MHTPGPPGRPARPTSGCTRSPAGGTRPYFTDAERAALALTEAVTRLADRSDPVPDEVWDEAARHYDETALAALVLAHRQHQRLEPAQRDHRPAGAYDW